MSDPPSTPWLFPADPPSAEWLALGPQLGIREPVLAALWNRGVRSLEEARRFLHPDLRQLEDPRALSGMAAAVARLRRAVECRERVHVFSDFDVDGLTSAALWTAALNGLGLPVRALLPDRLADGFGLTVAAIETVRAAGGRLLVTADCGTCAHLAAARARELGIDLIVADHHMPDGPLPEVCALVNPRLPGERYPFPELAAVGVVYKILQALVEDLERGGAGRNGAGPAGLGGTGALDAHLDLVALGTVADVVPLRGENRLFTRFGIERMRAAPRPAVRALAESAGLEVELLEAADLAFKLAPRLNAPGRLGAPDRSLALLLAADLEEARRRAEEVEADNRERRSRHERVLEEARRLIEDGPRRDPARPIVLGSANWHPGVLGIVAARLADRYRVPVLLVSLQGAVARGSARTPDRFDLLKLMATVSEHLDTFGGHRQAAGLSLRPERFAAVQEALESHDLIATSAADPPGLRVDGRLEPEAVDLELARQLDRLSPFGAGNAEPIFVGRAFSRDVRVEQGRHLRFRAGRGRGAADCVGFGLGPRAEEIPASGARIEMAYTPSINRHRGEERLQLKLRDFRLSEAGGGGTLAG